ncbi:MAG: ATP-dependent zinc metalloprotease FtsH [Chloroflexi bacterium]|nr:ATP-dependent zinc metalloprotease FtsH [Chloroflexota bacterium]
MRNWKAGKARLILLISALGVAIILAAAFFGPRVVQGTPKQPQTVSLSDLTTAVVQDTRGGYHDRVTIEPERVVASTSQGLFGAWTGGNDVTRQLGDQLHENGLSLSQVELQYQQPPSQASRMLWYLLPALLLIAVLMYVTRQAGLMNGRAFSFGRSKARRFQGTKSTVTLADVAGVDEAKEELNEIVQFLKAPERFGALGARIPRGVLLVGPPGTGKTLLSRAIAGEANVPFFNISGSEFVEMFVGVGASRVRDLFAEAKKAAPCIIFIDEIDAVGRKRGSGPGGGAHEEREQTLNQILVEMDGFDSGTNIIVTAATNRVDVLDPALLRPGRFDRHVTLDSPDVRGRQAILAVHAQGKPIDERVSLEVLAKQTPGFSGADLANVVNEAAILAARDEREIITMDYFEEAIDRVVGGPARKSRIMSTTEKRITAYHEAGHAIVGRSLPNCDPVHKVSIVSRGRMGGYTRFLPAEDRNYVNRSQFVDNLACLLGGMAAEELTFGESSTGPSNDLQRATDIARSMVTDYGMTGLAPVTYGNRESMVFKGGEASSMHNYSEFTAEAIDREVQALVSQARTVAREVLQAHSEVLQRIAERLIEDETINADQFEALYSGSPSVVQSAAPSGVVDEQPDAVIPLFHEDPVAHRRGLPALAASGVGRAAMTRRRGGRALRELAARLPRLASPNEPAGAE